MATEEQSKVISGRSYINEVTTLFIEIIEEGEGVFLGDRAHHGGPVVASVRCSKKAMTRWRVLGPTMLHQTTCLQCIAERL